MSRYRYSGDPYWLILKHPGKCAGRNCGRPLDRGERAFRFKSGKLFGESLDGKTCGCGTAESEHFEELAQAESMFNGGPY